MNLQAEITRAWELNASASMKLADAVVTLRDRQDDKARGEALVLLDQARKLHLRSNEMAGDCMKHLARSLDPSKCQPSSTSTSK